MSHPGVSTRRTFATLAVLLAIAATPIVAACDSDGDGSDPDAGADADADPADQRFPDIVAAVAERDAGTGTWTFRVTVSSPYDTSERYADGWRVVGGDGTVYGRHTLLHDHADEQPFTRTQTGVVIPDDVDEVTVEGRDRANGYGGATVTVTLDRD